MTDLTNPRKVHECGGQQVISMPRDWMREHGIAEGDQFRLEATDNGFQAVKVEWSTVDDV